MSGYIFAGLVGAVVCGAIWYKLGKSVARAQRAWRDLRATKDAFKGLWQRVWHEAGLVVRYGGIALAVLALAIGVLWMVA